MKVTFATLLVLFSSSAHASLFAGVKTDSSNRTTGAPCFMRLSEVKKEDRLNILQAYAEVSGLKFKLRNVGRLDCEIMTGKTFPETVFDHAQRLQLEMSKDCSQPKKFTVVLDGNDESFAGYTCENLHFLSNN